MAWEEVHRQTLGFPSLRIRQMSARIIWRSPPKIMSLLRRNSWDTMTIILEIGLSLILTICHFESHLWEHDQWVCPTLFPQQIIEARASCYEDRVFGEASQLPRSSYGATSPPSSKDNFGFHQIFGQSKKFSNPSVQFNSDVPVLPNKDQFTYGVVTGKGKKADDSSSFS